MRVLCQQGYNTISSDSWYNVYDCDMFTMYWYYIDNSIIRYIILLIEWYDCRQTTITYHIVFNTTSYNIIYYSMSYW